MNTSKLLNVVFGIGAAVASYFYMDAKNELAQEQEMTAVYADEYNTVKAENKELTNEIWDMNGDNNALLHSIDSLVGKNAALASDLKQTKKTLNQTLIDAHNLKSLYETQLERYDLISTLLDQYEANDPTLVDGPFKDGEDVSPKLRLYFKNQE